MKLFVVDIGNFTACETPCSTIATENRERESEREGGKKESMRK